MRQTPEIKRALDEAVPEYDPRGGEPRRRYYGRRALRGLVATVLAVIAAVAIALVLHHHLTRAQTAPAPPKPVPILIIPAQK